jgi:CelD/BcsL family acetyltransferase involved in cellulose biosynthesis
MLQGVRDGGSAAAMLQGVATDYEPTLYYVLELPATWEALRVRLKRSMKKTLGHCYNTLRREGRHYDFEIAEDTARLGPALDDFFRLHSARARVASAAVPHPDQYRTEQSRRFLRAVAADLAPGSRLMVCRLLIDGQLVASRLAFPVGDTLYLHHSGFDPAWWWYSVPTTLTAECIKMAIRSGFRAVNLSAGSDYSKMRWQPEVRRARAWVLAAPSVRVRLSARSAIALVRLREKGERWLLERSARRAQAFQTRKETAYRRNSAAEHGSV